VVQNLRQVFIDLKGKYKSKYLTFRDKLSKPDWVEHFNRISQFRLGDFEDVITEFDSPTTYFIWTHRIGKPRITIQIMTLTGMTTKG
jgi:hypothetical protein